MSDAIILNFKFELGATVRHATYLKQHDTYIGRVIAREHYEAPGTCGQWYYVRWLSPDGDPTADPVRLPESDLVLTAAK